MCQSYVGLIVHIHARAQMNSNFSIFGFQMNIPNILFTRRNGKMAIFDDKIS